MYYTLTKIKKFKADYNIIVGERSNGKTTSVLLEILDNYVKSDYKEQGAIIRRFEEDYKGKNGAQMFDAIIECGYISQMTNGKYNTVTYYSQRWWLAKYEDGNKVEQDVRPLLYGFAISSEEHYKSTAYPNVRIILFDEFITRGYYLPNEFILFQNLLSTIIRLRDDVVIYMCGNTVNRYCIYYDEMGLTQIKNMKKGTIDVYTYGNSNLKVAVEYSDFPTKNKKSNKYFAFDNPRLEMIKTGGWEIDIYPHLPAKFTLDDIIFTYYIDFKGELFTCKVINLGYDIFTFIHRKTTPIIEKEYPVYSSEIKPDYNYAYNIFKPRNNIEKSIANMFINKKIFYQDNMVGETIRNFLLDSLHDKNVV